MKLSNIVVSPELPIVDLVGVFDSVSSDTLLVCNSSGILLGVISAKEMREALVKLPMIASMASDLMNRNPITMAESSSTKKSLEALEKHDVSLIPSVDENMKCMGFYHAKGYYSYNKVATSVFILAGGRGHRMLPLTEKLPKPLLKVWGREMIGIVIDSMVSQGFCNFYISINYKGSLIRDYILNNYGGNSSLSIKFVSESLPMGTCGPLGLVNRSELSKEVIVVNADTVSNINYRSLLNHHQVSLAAISVASCEVGTQIPFGVLKKKNGLVTSIEEKPIVTAEIAAGIYCIDIQQAELIPKDQPYDFPDLISETLNKKRKVVTYLIHENWADVGNIKALEDVNAQSPYC